jgi:hypothetical protein
MSFMLASWGAALLAKAVAAIPAAAGESPLLGCWRITSQTTTMTDANGDITELKREPLGHIIATEDRIMIMVADHGRKPATNDTDKVALFDSFIGYTGKITLYPDRFVFKLDYSSIMREMGVEQTRYYNVDGDKLTIRTAEAPSWLQPDKRAVTVLTAVRD